MARRYASPEDFRLVGMDSDPTPGDPDLIQGVVQRYRDIGDAAEKALNVLKRDGTIAQGRGSAMDQLKQKIGDDLPDKLTKTATSYHDAAQAYSDYAPRLREAQDTFDRAVDRARAAAPQAGQAPQQLGENPTDEQKAEARRTQDAIDAGKSELNAAKGLAEQAKAMRQSAQRACADVLDRAAKEAIPERNVFQKIADFFKDFPFVQILLSLLVAVVSVFFPVAGLLLGGALFVLSQVSAIADGDFSLGDFLTGLLGSVPGGALLKAGGVAVKAGAGAVAKAAPGVSKTAGGSIKGIKASLDSSKTVGAVTGSTGGRVVGEAAKEFGKEAGSEAASEAIDGRPLDAGAILGAGALGAVGGGLLGAAIPKKTAGASSGTATRAPGAGGGARGGGRRPGGGRGGGAAAGPPPIPVKTASTTSGPPRTTTTPAAGTSAATTAPATTTPATTTPATTTPATTTPAIAPITLGAHEAPPGGRGGHTIARHVGKTLTDLKARGIPLASTFNDLAAAERATNANITHNAAAVSAFIGGAGPTRLAISGPMNAADGVVFKSATNTTVPPRTVTTVLQRSKNPPGFSIVTSFPGP
ncbi:RNase A-like domain-containing protein [Streptomyces sp. NRRL WC-3725]|uniref:RNase A-like domain-containing protein n=1 Tax=Streptomyces sp. NRRL WC-3725 TaxID=1463933 RepID=UPI0004CC3A23|nr:RNase A-like domain-containing protein [Streptomyces sp. NRRL WC-3725]